MSLSCSAKTIKYLLFLFNILFVITGIIILSVGISVKAYYYDYSMLLDDSFFSAPNLLIAIGAIIFIVAFFGCCGAVKENYCMTITFSTLLILIFILQLAAGIAGFALRNRTADFLRDKLIESIPKYNTTNPDAITKMWDTIQKTFDCCGATGPGDWRAVENGTNSLPMSCCANVVGAFGSSTCTDEAENKSLHTKGCVTAFGDFIMGHASTIGGVGIGFAVVQLLGIIFSCHLSKQIKNNYDNL